MKFKLIEIGLSRDINPFLVWMGKLDGSKSKGNSFWLLITLETNFILTMIVNCGLKVLLWEAGRSGAGGIGTKTNSASNCSLVWVEAELGKKL